MPNPDVRLGFQRGARPALGLLVIQTSDKLSRMLVSKAVMNVARQLINTRVRDVNVDGPSELIAEYDRSAQKLFRELPGASLSQESEAFLAGAMADCISELAYQRIMPYQWPLPPFPELPGRLARAAQSLDLLRPYLKRSASVLQGCERAISNAKRLCFRYSFGEPYRPEEVLINRRLGSGEVVALPLGLSVSLSLAPSTWNSALGPARPGRVLIRIGQTEPDTVLLFVEGNRPSIPTELLVVASWQGRLELLKAIADEQLWYCEGLDGRLGRGSLGGVHFSLWSPPNKSFLYLANMGSPLGVYIQLPQSGNDVPEMRYPAERSR